MLISLLDGQGKDQGPLALRAGERLTCSPLLNRSDEWALTLPLKHEALEVFAEDGAGLLVVDPQTSFVWSGTVERITKQGTDVLIEGTGDLTILADRDAHPRPDIADQSPAGWFTNPIEHTGSLIAAVAAFINYQAGATAVSARSCVTVSTDPDPAQAEPTITLAPIMEGSALDLIGLVAGPAGAAVTVTASGDGDLACSVRHSRIVTKHEFDEDLGLVAQSKFETRRATATHITGLGGTGTTPVVADSGATGRRRRERVSVGSASDQADLQSQLDNELMTLGPANSGTVEIGTGDDLVFGLHYELGDWIHVVVAGTKRLMRVTGAVIVISGGEDSKVTIQTGSPTPPNSVRDRVGLQGIRKRIQAVEVRSR